MQRHKEKHHTYMLAQAVLDGARRYYQTPKNTKEKESTRQRAENKHNGLT